MEDADGVPTARGCAAGLALKLFGIIGLCLVGGLLAIALVGGLESSAGEVQSAVAEIDLNNSGGCLPGAVVLALILAWFV